MTLINPRRASSHHRGIAIMTCMMLIAFIGVTLSAMTAHIAAEADRTRHIADDAQLRQMLTFATVELHARVQANGPAGIDDAVELALPGELAARKATLRADRQMNDQEKQAFRVTASLGSRTASQSLEFRKVGDQWRLHAATLTGQP